MEKLNFKTVLRDIDNAEICDFDRVGQDVLKDGKPVPLTAYSLASKALTWAFRGDEHATGEDKFKRWQLLARIRAELDAGSVLTAEEKTELKKLCGLGFAAPLVGPFWNFIEGK